MPEDAKKAIAEVTLGSRHAGRVEEPSERLAVPLLLRDEQPDDVHKPRIADPRRVLLGRADESRAVGGFAELPGAERRDNLREFLRRDPRPGIPRYGHQVV